MAKHHQRDREAQKNLDGLTKKRSRGRPQTIPRDWVIGRAENDRLKLTQVWAALSGPLLAANNEDQVCEAFEKHGQPYARDFVPRLASDVLALISHLSFPRRAKTQIGFLADSLAGRPTVSMRTSRDICSKERAKQRARSRHRITRYEFYVECECGYKGPARDNACRKCGAAIPSNLESAMWGT
jgi:hypothetical protein